MKLGHIILAVVITIVWGLNFVVAKAAVAHFPMFFLLVLRLCIVIAVLSPFLKKPPFPFKSLVKISFTLIVLHFGFMFGALEQGLNASVAVVLDQLRVPFAVVFSYFFFSESIGKKGVAGILLALVGTFIIVGTPNVLNNVEAFWLMLASSAAWALYNTQVKNLGELGVLSFIAWVSLLGMPQLLLISLFFEHGQWQSVVTASPWEIASLLYIAIPVTIMAHGCWYYLLRHYPINQVVPYSLLIPVFGMAAGISLLGEALTWEIIVGAAFTVVGVAVIVYRKPSMAEAGD